MNGSLGKKLISDLIRDIGYKGSNGLLRVSNGKSIKAVFFEGGVPVYAISNIASEQFESMLVNEGMATHEQIESAKQAAGKSQKLARTLVDLGIVNDRDVARVSLNSARRIIVSLFEWTKGEYTLDERVRAAHDFKLDWTVSDCLLEGGRSLAERQELAEAFAPDEGVVAKPKNTGRLLLTGKLNPTESYVYSRIDGNIQLNELANATGLPDEECRRAVLALLSLGLIKFEGKLSEEEQAPHEDDGDKIAEEISRMIHFFSNADYYEVLGVTLRSPSGDIKSSYYKLAKKYHPDRFRQPEQAELRAKVEALFAKVTEAYETLNDPAKRALYDDRLRKGQPKREQAPGASPVSKPAPQVAHAVAVPKPSNTTGPLASAGAPLGATVSTPEDSIAADSPAGVPDDAEPVKAPSVPTQPGAGVNAEFCYQQGKARLEHKEYYGAVQLLREAVRLDSSKAPYHFQLGLALMRNPRTRREGEQHLIKAAELEPFNAQIRVRLGLIYKEGGLVKKAESCFREALKLDPENRTALKELNGGGDKKDGSPIWKADLGTLAKRIFKK